MKKNTTLQKLQFEKYLNNFYSEIYNWLDALDAFDLYLKKTINEQTLRMYFENKELGSLLEIVDSEAYNRAFTAHCMRVNTEHYKYCKYEAIAA